MRCMKNSLVFLCLLALSCTKSPTSPSSLSSSVQLLVNPTFLWNGSPSLYGWSQSDLLRTYFSNDTPLGGSGNTLVFLPTGRTVQGIYQNLPALQGMHVYKLTFFGKINGIDVGANLAFVPAGRNVQIGGLGATVYDTTWGLYSVIDTLTANPGDSLIVSVGEGGCELCESNVSAYINSCRLDVK
jgi:hypothetical protein